MNIQEEVGEVIDNISNINYTKLNNLDFCNFFNKNDTNIKDLLNITIISVKNKNINNNDNNDNKNKNKNKNDNDEDNLNNIFLNENRLNNICHIYNPKKNNNNLWVDRLSNRINNFII